MRDVGGVQKKHGLCEIVLAHSESQRSEEIVPYSNVASAFADAQRCIV